MSDSVWPPPPTVQPPSGGTSAVTDATPAGQSFDPSFGTGGSVGVSEGTLTPNTADTYTVKPGDTLVTIARALYGHESNWQALLDANRNNPALRFPPDYPDSALAGQPNPELRGFAAPLEVPGTVLNTNLSRA